MKKMMFIIACFFLVGCQSNDETIDDQDEEIIEEENLIEETEQDPDNDVDEEDIEIDQEDQDETEADGLNDQASDSELEPEQKEDEDQDTSDESNSESGRYSPDEAIDLVQEYIQGTDSEIGLNFNFDGEDEQGNYRIQVFEVVDHGEGDSHTATYGWYLVNPETGDITDMFD